MNKVLTELRSPFKLAWESILAGKSLDETGRAMRSLFSDRSLLDTFGFTELHEASLGVSNKSFGDLLLSSSRATIDEVDAGQRSTLSWASQRDDLEMIHQLLNRGADPNKADGCGMTPLHWAGGSGSYLSQKALLDAGADVNRQDDSGRTTLMYAVDFGDDVETIKMLLDSHADMASRDCDGRTAIHFASWKDRPRVLSYFLEKGDDINVKDLAGYAPFAYAMLYQSHHVLKAFCNHENFNYAHICSRTEESILHLAARWADLSALKILHSARLRGVDVQKCDKHRCTALRVAQWRRDENVRWSDDELLSPDEDPLRCYAAIMELLDSMIDLGAVPSSLPLVRFESVESSDSESAERGQTEFLESEGDETRESDQEGSTEGDEESEDWQDASEIPVP